MAKIDKYIAFVKEHVGVQQKLAKKYEDSPYRKGQHLDSSRNFADLAEFLLEIQKKGTDDTAYLSRGESPQKKLNLTFEDIQGLPDELIQELNLSEADRQDLIVEHIIAQAGGVLTLDKIMVELYRRTGEIPKRNTLTSRLYRMAAKGMIFNVPAKKGVYSTYEMTEDQAKKLFGVDGDQQEDQQPSTQPQPASPQTTHASTSPLKRRFLSGAASTGRST